jgi:prolipoprotein diacylglyceryltransferase
VAATWLVLYPATRFAVESLRGDVRVLAGLTQAQVVSVPLAIAGILALVASRRVWWPSSAR